MSLGVHACMQLLETALINDKEMKWSSFMTNGWETFDRIASYWSKMIGQKKIMIFSIHRRFMSDANVAMLESLSRNAMIFDPVSWHDYYTKHVLPKPPVSTFMEDRGGITTPKTVFESQDPDKILTISEAYMLHSIIRQRMTSKTFGCPALSIHICPNSDGSICGHTWTSFDTEPLLPQKNCLLLRTLNLAKNTIMAGTKAPDRIREWCVICSGRNTTRARATDDLQCAL